MLYNKEQIKEIIPHRHEMLLIDEVLELEHGQSCIAQTHLKKSDWQFKGHFPEYAVQPGVLMVEALAQTGAVALLSLEENKGKLAFFAGIDKCKFRRQVVPGDTVRFEVQMLKYRRGIGSAEAKAYVDDELAVSCELTFAVGEGK